MFKKDSNFYSRVKEKVDGNWGKIVIGVLVFTLIKVVISAVINHNFIFQIIGQVGSGNLSLFKVAQKESFIFVFLSNAVLSIITSVIYIGLLIEGYKFVKTGEFNYKNIYANIKNHFNKILVCVSLIEIITSFLGAINSAAGPKPGLFFLSVSTAISINLSIRFVYLPYLIVEKENESVLDYLKDSWKLTKGIETQIISIYLYYFWFLFVGFVPWMIGTYFFTMGMLANSMSIVLIGASFLVVGFIWIAGVSLKKYPYVIGGYALFYEEHVEYLLSSIKV
mgnify:CR=1 FL=1